MPKKELKNQNENPLSARDIPETSNVRAIRYMTLQGGGMKGIGYLGAVEALENSGVFSQLEEVAGSSAGGITALLIAIGCTSDEIKSYLLDLNFTDFKDKEDAGWIESMRLKDFVGPLKEGLETVTDKINLLSRIPLMPKISASMLSTPTKVAGIALQAAEGLQMAEMGVQAAVDLGVYKGDVLSLWLSNIVAKKTGKPNITFAELAKLSQTENSPYKRLTLTGSNLTQKTLEYFNAQDYPDMPIVEAARISASFPGAFMPVKRPDKKGIMSVYVDGGLLENLPGVFNRPPYLPQGQQNNPEAIALILGTKEEHDAPLKIDNVIEFAFAMYKSTLSSKKEIDNYGKNAIYIDAVGVETLEFNASPAKKEALINSGRTSVENAFRNLIKVPEAPLNTLPIEELLRLRVALLEMQKNKLDSDDEEEILERLVDITHAIDNWITTKKISVKTLEKMTNAAETRIKKNLRFRDDDLLSEKELLEGATKKLEELKRTQRDILKKTKYLKLIESSLVLKRERIIQALQKNKYHNEFFQKLHDIKLKSLAKLIKENRKANATCDIKNKKMKDSLNKEYVHLITNLKSHLNELKTYFKKKGDDTVSDFFEDISRDCDKNNFHLPDEDSIASYYNRTYINVCQDLINEAHGITENMSAEYNGYQNTYKQYLALSEAKKDSASSLPELKKSKSERFSDLIELRKEINRSLNEKSHFWAKLNYKISEWSPLTGKILYPFFQFTSIASFITFMPLAIPAVALAKGMEYFSTSPETQYKIKRFIDFFRFTNINFEKKLRGLSKTTAHFVDVMQKNYENDKSESSYIAKIYSTYFENSGLKIEDILARRKSETDIDFKLRLAKIKESLSFAPKHLLAKIPARVPKPHLDVKHVEPQNILVEEANLENNLTAFRKVVLNDVLKISEQRVDKKANVKQKNISIIEKEYIAKIEKKLMQSKTTLTENEVNSYIKSLTALVKPYAEDFHIKYLKKMTPSLKKLISLHYITLKVKNQVELEPAEIDRFSEFMKEIEVQKNRTQEQKKLFKTFKDRYLVAAEPSSPAEMKDVFESFLGKRQAYLGTGKVGFKEPHKLKVKPKDR